MSHHGLDRINQAQLSPIVDSRWVMEFIPRRFKSKILYSHFKVNFHHGKNQFMIPENDLIYIYRLGDLVLFTFFVKF